MKKTIALVVILIAVTLSIFYLQQPETIMDKESGQEVTLGTVGARVSADIGNIAQDYLLADYQGTTHDLSSLRGKTVILNFWAGWCPFCVEEMPLFELAVVDRYWLG